jgi:hypothetical protein
MQAKTCSRGIILGLSVLAISAGCQVPAAAQSVPEAANRQAKPPARKADPHIYYVDFRSRTAASYGHAFAWYGRMDRKEVEVAGLHPASDSPIPFIIGHIIPVPSETGKSYGDLDEEYLTASYRVVMTEAEAKPVFAYIKHLHATSPTWGPLYQCIAFLKDIAEFMGLRAPFPYLTYPEPWVNKLRELNGGAENQLVKLSDIRAGVVPKSTQGKAARTAAVAPPDPGRSW